MTNRIQIWNKYEQNWLQIDQDTGCIIGQSNKPAPDIEMVAHLEMAH